MEKKQFNVTACCGYTIMAMQEAGLSDDNITKTMMKLMYLFDTVSEQEAVDHFTSTNL